MKIVLLVNGQSNQRALANKIAKTGELSAIVVSRNVPRKKGKRPLRSLVNRVEGRLIGRPFVRAWTNLLQRYDSLYPAFPDAPLERVNNINDEETLRTIASHKPDLVVVSGTNLVGKRVIEAANQTGRLINLHTGLSPYVKGGPNCTNWCLSLGRFDLIGNTVMWLDPGIDSGDIIATERTPLHGDESLEDLHWKVMEHGHDLYLRVIHALKGKRPVPRVPQERLDEGKLYFNADWVGWRMLAARVNFAIRWSPKYFQGSEVAARIKRLQLVELS